MERKLRDFAKMFQIQLVQDYNQEGNALMQHIAM